MTELLIAGLFVLCLACVGVIAYLASALRAAAAARRELDAVESLKTQAEVLAAGLREALAAARADGGAAATHAEEGEATSRTEEKEETTADATPFDEAGDFTPAPPEAAGGAAQVGAVDEADFFSLAAGMDDFFQRSAYPKDLLSHEYFSKGVEILKGGSTPDDLLNYSRGSNIVVQCMALEALARRGRAAGVCGFLVNNVNVYYYWPRYFALRALDAQADRPVLTEVLARAGVGGGWRDFVPSQSLREFVRQRLEHGEAAVTFEAMLEEVARLQLTDEQVGEMADVLGDLGGDLVSLDVWAELQRWRAQRVDVEFLKSFGRVWGATAAAGPHREQEDGADEIVMLDAVEAKVLEMETAIGKEPPRSVLLVGDSGTGKTTMVRALARKLQKERWLILEASASDVLAGQKYIGELEGRVQTLVRQIGGKRVLWVVPNFHEMLWAGRHQYSPTGILDLILPPIESGDLKVIGETTSAAYENLIRLRPKLRGALETCRVAPLGDGETLELARRWAELRGLRRGLDLNPAFPGGTDWILLSEQTLQEAFQLTKQYLSDKAAPGNLIQLLDSTDRRLLAERGRGYRPLTLDDLLVTLSQLTGLPAQILDDREGLDLSELRAFFERRVLGQPEAVDCLTERVAMIKAGLTDPTRPQGVFLFVGPTGTGKTEIAKTLAEFLFGSAERIVRLDMSEFQTADSLDRIVGDTSDTGESTALVNLIRKQPFSVILLDEFEKAHPNVWDLFLQVFDDGRLTDRRGNTADFRHSVVIMTSNLGATLPAGASIGFSQEQAQFAAASVERAVGRAFRREFINRIDRVVVFRPLGRAVMREILRKELTDVLRRRGLRTRQWAVEWDDSAIEFLLEKGFTADLGARPLKRAIERFLLSPLAMTIVNHQFPEGDQFLFVRSRADSEALDVQFVDPDAPEQSAAATTTGALPAPAPAPEEFEELTEAEAAELRLESVALDARGTLEEVRFLQTKYREVEELVEAEDWRQRKDDALLQTASPDFWDSPGRFAVLGLAEYMDRIEAGLDTAGSLLARLTGSRERDRTLFPRDLVARLAEQLYLIDAACRGLVEGQPRDAFLSVRASRDAGTDRETSEEFARRLAQMYRRWAEKRRMRLDVLEETGGGDDGAGGGAGGYGVTLNVSGFAAYPILRREAGLHVLETPQDERHFNRARVLVRVVPQPDEPAEGRGREAVRRQAERAFAADQNASQASVVRRYREEPSPLVRDSARGWRTGKLERVLGGDFDLMF